MIRGISALWMAAVALLAGCSGGDDRQAPAAATSSAVKTVMHTPDLAEGEEDIAVHPGDQDTILIGSNQFQPFTRSGHQGAVPGGPSGIAHCALWVSHDGGQSWRGGPMGVGGLDPVDLAELPNLPLLREVPGEFQHPGNVLSADQSVVFARDGTAYYECINFGVFSGDIVIPVWRSDDGGRTWNEPVIAFSETDTQIQVDRPFLAIDNSGGPRDGTVYLSFETQFYQGTFPEVYLRSSSDRGETWGPITRVDNSELQAMWNPRVYPAVDAGGAVYVMYASAPTLLNGALSTVTPFPADLVTPSDPIAIVVARSDDGGASFQRYIAEPDAHRIESPDEALPQFMEMIAAIATEPGRPGHLAVAWPDLRSGEARILMRTTMDAGASWSDPLDVSDAPRDQGIQHDHVAMDFTPDGRGVVVWRDRRNSDGGFEEPFDVFARPFRITEDGARWGDSVRVTESAQPPTTGKRGAMPSEYLAVDATAAGADISWDQMAGALPDNVYRRIPPEALSVP